MSKEIEEIKKWREQSSRHQDGEDVLLIAVRHIDTLLSALEKAEGDYQKIIKEVLLCDPIPACKRTDGHLEPPWEVISRMRKELWQEKERVEVLIKDKDVALRLFKQAG